MYLKWRRRTRCPGFDNNGCPIKATCCIIKEKKYELCLYCLRIIKLDFEFIYLQKQHRVCRHLIDVFGKGHFVFESNLRRKSSRRVDIVKYFKETNTYLVIEIDEGQHQRHNMTKEEHRMSCLRSVGNIIFIRYNPDEYYVVGDGILNPSFEERMDVLVDEIKKQEFIAASTKTNDTIYLFYDMPRTHVYGWWIFRKNRRKSKKKIENITNLDDPNIPDIPDIPDIPIQNSTPEISKIHKKIKSNFLEFAAAQDSEIKKTKRSMTIYLDDPPYKRNGIIYLDGI